MGSPSRGARCASWALQRCPPAAEAGARGAAAARAGRRRSRRSCPGRAAAAHLAEALRRRGSPARPGMAKVTTCHQRCAKYPQEASLTVKTTVKRVASGQCPGGRSTSGATLALPSSAMANQPFPEARTRNILHCQIHRER